MNILLLILYLWFNLSFWFIFLLRKRFWLFLWIFIEFLIIILILVIIVIELIFIKLLFLLYRIAILIFLIDNLNSLKSEFAYIFTIRRSFEHISHYSTHHYLRNRFRWVWEEFWVSWLFIDFLFGCCWRKFVWAHCIRGALGFLSRRLV